MPARALIPSTFASLLVLAAAPAVAEQKAPTAYPPFPTARGGAAMETWVRRHTDLPPDEVVGVAADSLFAVDAPRAAGSRVVRAVIRQEAITPEFAKRLGGRSASMSADIDCRGRRVFQREVVLYAGSNRQGAGRPMGAARDWQAIPAGTFMEKVMTAVCDPEWRPLFAQGPQPVRQAAKAEPPPPPAPPPPPPPPPPTYAAPQAPQAYAPQAYASQTPAPRPYAPPPAAYAPPPPVAYAAGPQPRQAFVQGPTRADLGRFPSADAAVNALSAVAAVAPLSAALRVEQDGQAYRALVEGFMDRDEAERFCLRVRGCTLR